MKLTINRKNDNDVTICWHDVIAKIFLRLFFSLVRFSYLPKFYVNIITGSGVMAIFFNKGLRPEIRKSEISPFEFFPTYEDWGKLGISNLARMSLMKCYWMPQNARVPAFTVSELLKENQQGEVKSPPTQIRVKNLRF